MSNPIKPMAVLDMFQHPVFCVKDGLIRDVNAQAAACGFATDTPITQILSCDEDAYGQLKNGCLCVGVQVAEIPYVATVLPTEDGDIFHLQSASTSPELRMMTLAAQQLRAPLSELLTATETLLKKENIKDSDESNLVYKNLFRMMREISNMSAISSYSQDRRYGKETKNITAVINEVLEKAQALCNHPVHRLDYTPCKSEIYCPTDREMLERALYNLISNAIKFSPEGSVVSAQLTAGKNKVCFSIQSKLDDTTLTQGNLFMRYIRDAAVEDGRHGLGLGIPLTQCAAVAHNGTLLMDYPEEGTVRFSLTLSTVPGKEIILKSPFPTFDYMGGWDHGLVELSDILPASAFKTK